MGKREEIQVSEEELLLQKQYIEKIKKINEDFEKANGRKKKMLIYNNWYKYINGGKKFG